MGDRPEGAVGGRERSVRVLVVDDHLIVREGLKLVLETVEGIDIVGEACDGEGALLKTDELLAAGLGPDVVLMDLRMPGMGGLEAIRRLKETRPDVAVVILTTYNEDDLMIHGLRAGASAFLLKDAGRLALAQTIRAAASGDCLLDPQVMARLLAYQARASVAITDSRPALSARELEVLRAVASGMRSKEIAVTLAISERTIKAHLSNIYAKLGVDSRAGAVSVAMGSGLLD